MSIQPPQIKANKMPEECRCCLYECSNLTDMRNKSLNCNDQFFNCLEAYCFFTGLSIEEILEISADLHICEACSDQLLSALIFSQMSQKANEILRNKQFQNLKKDEPIAVDECFILSDSESEKEVVEDNDLRPYQGRSKEFVCSECIEVFSNPVDLVQHLATHSSRTEIKAETVDETVAAAGPEYKYKCSKCLGAFQFLGELRDHLTNSHTTKVTATETDTEDSPTTETPVPVKLEQHVNEKISSPCFVYEETVETEVLAGSSNSALQGTLSDPLEKPTESCVFCLAPFRTLSGLQRHIERVHANEKIEDHGQQSCSKRKRVSLIDLDYMFQQTNGNDSVNCSFCSNKFKNQANLMRHIEREHSNNDHTIKTGKYKCNVCSKTYNHVSTLKHHQENHANGRKFSCNICSAKYKHSTNLLTHLRKHKEKKVTLKCKKCSKKFQSQGGLLLHDQIHHQHLFHECRLCESKFKNMMGLYRHAFDHLQYSPFNCPQCDFKNRTKKDFVAHLERKHDLKFVEKIHGCQQSTKEILDYVRKPRNSFTTDIKGVRGKLEKLP